MNYKMTTLEDITLREFKAGKTSVERALLVISGLETEEAISSYHRKLDFIQNDFERSCPERAGDYQTAKSLFDYLWETKPKRYNSDFLLAKVIDNQLDEDKDKTVGNCVGLTSLYSVLGVRLRLDLSVLANNDHILTLLSCNNQEIAVENTGRYKFDFELKSRYKKADLIVLLASAFNSRGVVKYDLGDLDGALRDYNRTIEFGPDYASAFNNRGIVKYDLSDLDGALRDYNQAIELKPDYVSAFYKRGIVKHDLSDFDGALRDYNQAIELKPDYASAFNNRGIVKEDLGNLNGALADYNRAIELKPDYFKAIHNQKRVLEMITSSKNHGGEY